MENRNEVIDRIEEAMRQAYRTASGNLLPSDTWRTKVMRAVYARQLPETLQIDRLANRLLRLAWTAAGIAACLLLVTTLFHQLTDDKLTRDFLQLYADDNNSIEQLTEEWPQ